MMSTILLIEKSHEKFYRNIINYKIYKIVRSSNIFQMSISVTLQPKFFDLISIRKCLTWCFLILKISCSIDLDLNLWYSDPKIAFSSGVYLERLYRYFFFSFLKERLINCSIYHLNSKSKWVRLQGNVSPEPKLIFSDIFAILKKWFMWN